MKTRFLLIGMILIAGVLLAGFGLDFARAQGERVTASDYPVMNWERVSEYGFGLTDNLIGGITALEVYNGSLYAGPTSAYTQTIVFRTSDGTSWEPASEQGLGLPLTGPQCDQYWQYIWDMTVFDNQLYAAEGMFCFDTGGYMGGMIVRTIDGITWEPVVTDSFGYSATQAVNILTVFEDMIYAGTADMANGTHIYRSNTGDVGDWEDVTPSNLVNPIHYYANDFEVYHDMLFMSTQVFTSSVTSQIWSSPDGLNWEDGPMDMYNNCETDPACGGGALAVFSDTLYLDVMIYGSAGELWSTNNGITWTLTITTGDNNLYSITPLGVYDGHLYLGSNDMNWGPGKLWRSADGVTFENASKPGFDLTSGAAIFPNAVKIFQDHLYLGKFNWEIGGSIWRNAPFYIWLPSASK